LSQQKLTTQTNTTEKKARGVEIVCSCRCSVELSRKATTATPLVKKSVLLPIEEELLPERSCKSQEKPRSVENFEESHGQQSNPSILDFWLEVDFVDLHLPSAAAVISQGKQ